MVPLGHCGLARASFHLRLVGQQQFPGLKERICDESGQVRRFVNFYLNDEDIRHRFKAHEALLLLTQLDFGFIYDGEPRERKAAVEKWEGWFASVEARGY